MHEQLVIDVLTNHCKRLERKISEQEKMARQHDYLLAFLEEKQLTEEFIFYVLAQPEGEDA